MWQPCVRLVASKNDSQLNTVLFLCLISRGLMSLTENSVVENGKFASRHRVVIPKIDSNLRENTPTTEYVAPTTKSRTVKLPYLQLQKFGGNPTDWGAFWDSFSSAIHNSEDLDNVQKFNYLKSYLYGNAARALDGLAATRENNAEAVEMLCDRFGINK